MKDLITELLQSAVKHEKAASAAEHLYRQEKSLKEQAANSAALHCFPEVAIGDEFTTTFRNWRRNTVTETYRVIRFGGSVHRGKFTAHVYSQKVTKNGSLSKSHKPTWARNGEEPKTWRSVTVDLSDLPAV